MTEVGVSERGAVNLATVAGLFIVGTLVVSANIPITRSFTQSNIQVLGAASGSSAKVLADKGKTAIVEGNTGALVGEQVAVGDPSQLGVLPNKAVGDTLASKIIDEVDSVKVSGSLASVNRMVRLENSPSGVVYQIDGYKKGKLLGLIPVNKTLQATVSTQTGQVLQTKQSLLGKILNKIAP